MQYNSQRLQFLFSSNFVQCTFYNKKNSRKCLSSVFNVTDEDDDCFQTLKNQKNYEMVYKTLIMGKIICA